MGRMVNKEQTQSKPNEGFQLHRPELLIAAAHGDTDEIKRLLLLHREEDAARQPVEVVLDVTDIKDTVADVEKPAATAIPPSQAVTGAGDSALHVVASSGDGDEFLECATVIVGNANHLLGARNWKGDTPLHCAARLRNARMVSRLLALARASDGTSDERDGASDERVKVILRMQNGKEETVLHEAVRLEDKEMIGHWDIAQLLFEKDKELSYSGPDGRNALHAAIQWKWGEEAIKMLLKRNKDVIKQADRSTGSTPLHFAAKWGAPMGLLLDSNGSFPIHVAASNGHPDNVLALLQKCGHYCAQLRDGKGRTFLHVAVQDERWAVVRYACQEQGKMLASSVMNMQDEEGNTALHLAVEVGNMRALNDLLSLPEVKLNLKKNKGQIPRDLAFSKVPKGPSKLYWNTPPRIYELLRDASRSSNTDSRIYWLLHDVAHLTASPRENILPREMHNEEDRSQSIIARTQIIGLGSVLITTVTFAAAFAVPGGYRADGTPTLAGQYAFDAFVMANTLAFTFSCLSIILLMVAGFGVDSGIPIFSLLNSVNYLAWSAKSLGATFVFGTYAVLAPVELKKAILSCSFTVIALMVVEAGWTFIAVQMVYSDKVVLVKRFGISRAWWRLALAVLWTLMSELGPYIIIASSGIPLDSGRK